MGTCASSDEDVVETTPKEKEKPREELYFDSDGNLRVKYHIAGSRPHDPQAEFEYVQAHDSTSATPGELRYAVVATWMDEWLRYVTDSGGPQPDPINNGFLISKKDPATTEENGGERTSNHSNNSNKGGIGGADDGDGEEEAGTPRRPTTLRPGLRPEVHYRDVCARVWEFFWKLYGGEPVVSYIVPENLEEEDYKDGKWLAKMNLAHVGTVYWPDKAAVEARKSVDSTMESNPMLAEANADMIGNMMLGDLGANKMREAKKLDGEINQENADAIGALMMKDAGKRKMQEAAALESEAKAADSEALAATLGKDLGRKRMEEAKKREEEAKAAESEAVAGLLAHEMANKKLEEATAMQEEQDQAQLGAVGSLFADDAANRQREEARKKEEEAKAAAAEALANQLAADMAEQKLKAAREAEEQAKEEQTRALMERMKNLGAGLRFRTARENGLEAEMKDAAAAMLQGAWRSKLAYRAMEAKKAEQEALAQEGAARKLQACYRSRLARRRAAALKAEKERMMEEACARKLQSAYRKRIAKRRVQQLKEEREAKMQEFAAMKFQAAWRIRKARKRAAAMRAEKERLEQEGAALKFQSAWRIRKARKRAAALREEKERLQQEGCAIMLQSAWRIKKSREQMERLKAERERLREEGAALMFQSAWRVRQARAKVSGLREQRDATTKLSAAWRGKKARAEFAAQKRSALLMAAMVRKFCARKKVRQMQREKVQPILVHLYSCEGLRAADRNDSDPHVFISAHPTADAPNTFLTQSRVIPNTVDPDWDEDFVVANITLEGMIRLTVADHDTFSAPDFLGEARVDLKEYPHLLWEPNGIELTLPLGGYSTELAGEEKPVKMDSTDVDGQGTITFRLIGISHTKGFCGPIQKVSKGMMRRENFSPRYMVCTGERLLYEANAKAMAQDKQQDRSGKGLVPLADVTSLEIVEKLGHTCIAVTNNTGGKQHELFFYPEGDEKLMQVWLRKLTRCCPNIPSADAAEVGAGERK